MLTAAASGGGSAQDTDLPSIAPDELSRRIRDGLRLDDGLEQRFAYLERQRDVKVSRLGKVTIGPLRTFEVRPGSQPGKEYKRLIAVDGLALTADELRARDAAHAQDLEKARQREQSETPRQRAARLAALEEEQRRREAMLADTMAVFEPSIVGRDRVDGVPVLLVDIRPRAEARVATREGNWMKRFAGRAWIEPTGYQVVRLELRATADLTIGFGVVGRIHRGSGMEFSRRRLGAAWVPAELTYQASGRTLLFRPFRFNSTTTYDDYQPR